MRDSSNGTALLPFAFRYEIRFEGAGLKMLRPQNCTVK